MKLVEHHLRVAAGLRHAAPIGLAHVHAGLRDRMPMAIVRFQRLDEPLPGGFISAFRGEHHPLAQQVGKHADILLALTNVELIDAHATHVAKIGFGVGSHPRA